MEPVLVGLPFRHVGVGWVLPLFFGVGVGLI